MGENAQRAAFAIAEKVRKAGLSCETDVMGRSLKAQMRHADKINARYTIVLGDSELESRRAVVKKMEDGTQTEICVDDVDGIVKTIEN